MNFRPELAQAVLDGRKTVTRRLANMNPRSPWYVHRCSLKVNRTYAVCPGRGKDAIGRARIVNVWQERVGLLSEEEARREGFASPAEFYDAWRSINGCYDPNAIVWRVELEALR